MTDLNELDFNSELNICCYYFELSNNSTNISFCCFQSNVEICCLKNDKYSSNSLKVNKCQNIVFLLNLTDWVNTIVKGHKKF